MSDKQPKLKLSAGALPYSDGSGDQVTATIERKPEGVMLRVEMTHEIPIDQWSIVRGTIQELVESATKLMNRGV